MDKLVLVSPLLGGMLSGRVCEMPKTSEHVKITPPGWVFGLVWPVLYILLGVVGRQVYKSPASETRTLMLGIFLVNLLANFSWSPVFSCKSKKLALIPLVLTLLSAFMLYTVVNKEMKYVWSLALVPYLVWLMYAVHMNVVTVQTEK